MSTENILDKYFIVKSDGEAEKLHVAMWVWNDNSDRDRLLALLIIQGLESGSLSEQDLHDAGFLHKGQSIKRVP